MAIMAWFGAVKAVWKLSQSLLCCVSKSLGHPLGAGWVKIWVGGFDLFFWAIFPCNTLPPPCLSAFWGSWGEHLMRRACDAENRRLGPMCPPMCGRMYERYVVTFVLAPTHGDGC